MAINPTYKDRVRYTLQHKDYGTQVIIEPIGWQTDEKEYARNEKYHGIFAKFSNSLKFVDDGADFIKLIRRIYGINADIRMIREEQHPHTDEWVKSYDGYLDLSTYVSEDGQVSVKFDASGLEKMLSARESEKVEIERLDTMDGMPLEPLDVKNVILDGRRIFLKSLFKEDPVENSQLIYVSAQSGSTQGKVQSIPIIKTMSSHSQAESTIVGAYKFDDNFNPRQVDGTTGLMFFLSSDRDRELHVKLDMSFGVEEVVADDLSHWTTWIRIVHYTSGNLFKWKANYDLFTKSTEAGFENRTINVNFDQLITLERGDSLGLVADSYIDVRPLHDGLLGYTMENIKVDLSIEENSFFEPTTSKTVLAHELSERLVKIITNNDNELYSEALGRTDIGYDKDGVDTGALVGFSHGHWIRNFDRLPLAEDNKYKGFSTSFKEFMENEAVTWNLGLGIERIGYKERVRIESQDYFYNNNVTVILPNQVKKVKRSEAEELYYSGLEFGFTKGGDYEEAMGLDEYNVRSTFTTIINRVKNVYSQISKYRADSYGMEFARRKQRADFATEDTSYDSDIFNMDLKRFFGNDYKQRKWQDDFEQEPTGIFSPETATNLRLSPFNIMLRHGWVIASGLTKYLNDYVRYGSSEANSNLTTKLNGGKLYAENGNIKNSELKRARFVNEWIEFEHVVTFDIIKQIEGTSTIQGKKIPNFYGLVEFTNEDNEIEKGFLFNLKPNDGKWKLLKANR